jgi:outer membrane lipoprotein-sorting protein
MNTTTYQRLKFTAATGLAGLAALALGVGLAACRPSVATTAVSTPASGGDSLSAQEIAAKSREAYAALSSYSDSGKVVWEMGGQQQTVTFHTRLQRPNQYRIDWARESEPTSVAWSDGGGDYLLNDSPRQGGSPQPQKMSSMKRTLAQATGLSLAAASTVPGAFFGQDLGDVFIAPVLSGRHPLNKEPDAKVGDVDCYVVSSVLDFSKIPDNKGKPGTASTTLWIGKRDLLLHQCRTKYVEQVDSGAEPTDQAVDDASRKALAQQHKPVTPEAVAAMRPQMRAIMKQVHTTLKAGFEAGVVSTQTHQHIVVNNQLSPSAFAR